MLGFLFDKVAGLGLFLLTEKSTKKTKTNIPELFKFSEPFAGMCWRGCDKVIFQKINLHDMILQNGPHRIYLDVAANALENGLIHNFV